jgi:hypothetical protein
MRIFDSVSPEEVVQIDQTNFVVVTAGQSNLPQRNNRCTQP